MNRTGKTIVKNAGALMASQLLTWALALIMMVFLPRYLGATGMGQLHLASSIWMIMGILAVFGMDVFLTKEIARQPERLSELFATSVVLRLLLFIIGFGVVAVYANLVHYAVETVYVIYIIGVANLIRQLSFACRASLQGLERMEYISISDIAGKAFNTFVSIGLLLLGQRVLVIAAVVIGANLVHFAMQFYYLHRLQALRLQINWHLAGWILKSSFPYLMVSVFLVVYIQLDVVIISLFVHETVVGWYSVADQLFGTFLFIPTVFITAVFPVLSRLYTDESDSLSRLMQKSFDLLLILGVPIGLGVLVISNPLVILLFGPEFANSGPVLAVMGIVLILTYQNTLLGKFLISVDRQNAWTKVMAVATLVTIPLDLILVPWCQNNFGNGAIGGALAFVVTESGMLLAGFKLLPKGALGKTNAWLAVRILLAGLVMSTVTWMVRHAFIVIPVATGAIIYALMLWALRIVPQEDWILFKKVGYQTLGRFRGSRAAPASLGD